MDSIYYIITMLDYYRNRTPYVPNNLHLYLILNQKVISYTVKYRFMPFLSTGSPPSNPVERKYIYTYTEIGVVIIPGLQFINQYMEQNYSGNVFITPFNDFSYTVTVKTGPANELAYWYAIDTTILIVLLYQIGRWTHTPNDIYWQMDPFALLPFYAALETGRTQ
jgi:hypothetical protein